MPPRAARKPHAAPHLPGREAGLPPPMPWGLCPAADTSILHHFFLLLFSMFLVIISLYKAILMRFLSYLASFTWRGRLPAGPEKATSEIDILQRSKWPKNLRRIVLELIKNIGRRIIGRGPAKESQAQVAPPWGTPCELVAPPVGLHGPPSPMIYYFP